MLLATALFDCNWLAVFMTQSAVFPVQAGLTEKSPSVKLSLICACEKLMHNNKKQSNRILIIGSNVKKYCQNSVMYLAEKTFRYTFAPQCKKQNIQNVTRKNFLKGKLCNVGMFKIITAFPKRKAFSFTGIQGIRYGNG